VTVHEATSPVPDRPALLNAFRGVAGLLALLVLLQAVMAGRAQFGDWSIEAHGIVGNVSFLLAVGGLVLAIITRAPRGVVVVAGVIVALMVVQIVLGYGGQEAAAWHVPNGVAIFGLTVYQVSIVRRTALATPAP
jgi:hypothetical protein